MTGLRHAIAFMAVVVLLLDVHTSVWAQGSNNRTNTFEQRFPPDQVPTPPAGSNLRRSRRFDKLRPNLPPIMCAQDRIPYDRPGKTRLQGASIPRSSRRLLGPSASPGRDAPDRV